MKQMLKKADYIRSRRLNTIMEMTETQDENENLLADSIPVKEHISSGTCNAASLTTRRQDQSPSRDRSTIYNPHEERVFSSHAMPQTRLATTSHWREKPSVSIKPAGVDSNSSESLTRSPVKQDTSEVEFFFPEFFTDSEAQCARDKIGTSNNERNKYIQGENEDPLVQSWLDLFGSQVYG